MPVGDKGRLVREHVVGSTSIGYVEMMADIGKINAANIRSIINVRCLDRTMHLEEEINGRTSGLLAQQSRGGAKAGGEASTTACLHKT
jgi:hypothetical protein